MLIGSSIFGAEQAVARIAQTGHDIAVLVELLIACLLYTSAFRKGGPRRGGRRFAGDEWQALRQHAAPPAASHPRRPDRGGVVMASSTESW